MHKIITAKTAKAELIDREVDKMISVIEKGINNASLEGEYQYQIQTIDKYDAKSVDITYTILHNKGFKVLYDGLVDWNNPEKDNNDGSAYDYKQLADNVNEKTLVTIDTRIKVAIDRMQNEVNVEDLPISLLVVKEIKEAGYEDFEKYSKTIKLR